MLLYRLIASLIALLLIVVNIRLYAPLNEGEHAPIDEESIAQLRFLHDAIGNGVDREMQEQFPEGFVFIHVLHGLSWLEVARAHANPAELRHEAIEHARHALRSIGSPEGRRPFIESLNPAHGIFYSGWKTWLRGAIIAAQDMESRDTAALLRFTAECSLIADAFDSSSTPFLQTYPGAAWPADALVAIAALRLHDHLTTPRFTETIERWIAQIHERLDPQTGLIPHSVDALTGMPLEGARGSSQSLMLRFLMEIDPALAQSHYRRYRELFTTSWIGLPGIREYPHGTDGDGDIDSGPVAFGIGSAATIVDIGTARMFGDHELASKLNGAVESLGLPMEWSGRRRYLFGALPIGDAFLIWSRLARPYTTGQSGAMYEEMTSEWWRIPFHGVSVGIVVMIAMPVLRKRRRQRLP